MHARASNAFLLSLTLHAGVVLIKGSRGARMERAVAALRALLPESAAPGAEQGRC